MDVIVQLEAGAARALRGLSGDLPALHALLDSLRAMGVTLEALHPGVTDPPLSSYYRIIVADPAEAERIASTLRAFPVIEAAYVKPDAEPA